MVKPQRVGKNIRMSFSKIDEPLQMPNLIEIQKDSYKWFVEEGLKEVFADMSSITDYTGNLVLDFIDYRGVCPQKRMAGFLPAADGRCRFGARAF